MAGKKEKSPLDRKEILLRASESIPFVLVSLAFFVNLFSGIALGIDLLTVMVRGILAVLLFSVVGFFLSRTLKGIIETLEKDKADEEMKKNTVEFSSEPDDGDLLKEMRMPEEGFEEASPADFTGNTN